MGKGYQLRTQQILPYSQEEVFAFFADAFQLETLTPPILHFSVLTPSPIDVKAGTLIDYKLRLHGIPIRWRSRISVWEPPTRFVDEQIRGSYQRWYHEHTFEPVDGGTLCRDVVDYAVPGGSLVHRFFVRPDLLKIFTYRQKKMDELFPCLGTEP
jgi:ligand-binding SRPBCC domain-containing protein